MTEVCWMPTAVSVVGGSTFFCTYKMTRWTLVVTASQKRSFPRHAPFPAPRPSVRWKRNHQFYNKWQVHVDVFLYSWKTPDHLGWLMFSLQSVVPCSSQLFLLTSSAIRRDRASKAICFPWWAKTRLHGRRLLLLQNTTLVTLRFFRCLINLGFRPPGSLVLPNKRYILFSMKTSLCSFSIYGKLRWLTLPKRAKTTYINKWQMPHQSTSYNGYHLLMIRPPHLRWRSHDPLSSPAAEEQCHPSSVAKCKFCQDNSPSPLRH